MSAWLDRLEQRERIVLILGALFVLVAFFYLSLWEPITARHARLQDEVSEQRKLTAWMERAAMQVRDLRNRRVAGNEGGEEQSLLTLVDLTAKAAGLASTIKRIEPEGNDRVRVWLESSGFDAMIRWLTELRQGHRTKTSRLHIERTDLSGEVDARLTLTRQN